MTMRLSVSNILLMVYGYGIVFFFSFENINLCVIFHNSSSYQSIKGYKFIVDTARDTVFTFCMMLIFFSVLMLVLFEIK